MDCHRRSSVVVAAGQQAEEESASWGLSRHVGGLGGVMEESARVGAAGRAVVA